MDSNEKLHSRSAPFARWVFRIAGIYGVLVTIPLYFTERQHGIEHPPAITHPEFYYGFAGLCLAWQIVFLLIATNPLRYRPLMPICVLEKYSFVIAIAILFPMGRVDVWMVAAAGADAVLGLLFIAGFFKTSVRTESAGI